VVGDRVGPSYVVARGVLIATRGRLASIINKAEGGDSTGACGDRSQQ